MIGASNIRRSAAIAALGGLVFSLAAPPVNLYPAVLVGLGLCYAATRRAESARGAALLGLIWATCAGIVGMAFIPGVIARFTPVGHAGGVVLLVLLSVFQAGAWAGAAALGRVLQQRCGFPGPLAFGAVVMFAISVPTVIAWSPAALLSPWPILIQPAELIGERGVSFLLAVAAALAAGALGGERVEPALARRPSERAPAFGRTARPPSERAPAFGRTARPPSERAPAFGRTARRPRMIWAASSAALFLGLLAYGAVRMPQVRAHAAGLPVLRVGVVQAAVPARLRWEPGARPEILARLRRLTREGERQGAELTLWPEAAYPHLLPHQAGPTPRDERALVGAGVRGPLLVGMITQPAGLLGQHNSAALVGPDGWMQMPQAKLELLWFGETVPLGQYLPFLRKIFSRTGGLLPGQDVSILRDGAAKIGVLNCYEDILPGIGRRIAREAPNLLINVTNDAWFGPTSEPELHLRLSVLRAVETRLDLVRAVNLGVPAWIDATGTIRTRGYDDRQSVMVVAPALNDRVPTLYVSVGDVPGWVGLSLLAFAGFVRLRRRRTTAAGSAVLSGAVSQPQGATSVRR